MKSIAAVLATSAVLCAAVPAESQVDAREPLRQIISAFQMCGPPQVYQMLSPQLFNIIYQQTGGSGCYQQIAQAGPIVGMQVLDQQEFPEGTVYVIRVSHSMGPVDWFMGVNRQSGRVELLTFQPVSGGPPPRVETGPPPSPPIGGGGGNPGGGSGGSSGGDGCELYPSMC